MVSNMWKSPIEIQQDIVRQVDMVIEDGVMKAIQRFDINVDKEELLKALQYDRGQYEKGYQDGLNESKWIPCSERLPKRSGNIIACFSSGTVVELFYKGKGIFQGIYEYSTDVIIAWMPLPEPYKGE